MELLNSFPQYWLWLGLVIVFILVELSTTALVSIWFMVGSLAALLVSYFTNSFSAQCLTFAAVSALALFITRPMVRKLRTHKTVATGADRNVGRTAVVLEPIRPGFTGRVRLDGVDWNASSDQTLSPDTPCIVLKVQGTTLVVTPLPGTNA